MIKQRAALLVLVSLAVLFACQKEKSRENSRFVSTGTLTSAISGECLPKTVYGVYEAGVALKSDSNYIAVQVDVVNAGSYNITSDTINGISFSGKGTFGSAGLNSIKLKGLGTPAGAGLNTFTITYDSTICVVAVTVLPAGAGGPAIFTLNGAPATCTDFIVAGDFIKAVATTSLNTVQVKVNVTQIGGYNITTVVSNGVSFSGVGTLGSLGESVITLTASGTPINAGPTNWPVTVDGTTCNFSVDCFETPPVNDYFPLTTGSNWSYEYDDEAEDSFITRVTPDRLNAAGNEFSVFMGTSDEVNEAPDTLHSNRKSGTDYFRYANISEYLGFDEPHYTEFNFLKDNQAISVPWYTGETDVMVAGTPFSFRIKYVIVQKGVPLNITTSEGPKNFQSVIVVDESYQLKSPLGGDWQDAPIGSFRDYYARGVGLVKDEQYDFGSTIPTTTLQLRRWVIAP